MTWPEAIIGSVGIIAAAAVFAWLLWLMATAGDGR